MKNTVADEAYRKSREAEIPALIAQTRVTTAENGERVYLGLTDYEVRRLAEKGEINRIKSTSDRSVAEILANNIFSFFNLINLALAVLVFSVHSYKNALFIFVAVSNTLIGIIQEIRAKIVLDRLRILTISHVRVIRNGRKEDLPINELVRGDVAVLGSGDQVPADAVILQGMAQVIESLLTGESDAVTKREGDRLLSGSFIAGGSVTCLLTAVGSESYIEQLAAQAKQFKEKKTELQKNLDTILKTIGIIIIPVGLMIFTRRYWLIKTPYENAVLDTVAAVLGMIPEGLVLLTSVSLAVGSIHLARKKTLVRELFCIESLARADVLCLDKTGTITEGKFSVIGEEAAEGVTDFSEKVRLLVSVLPPENETIKTIKAEYKPVSAVKPAVLFPFSSEKKFSGAVIPGRGTFLLGASQSLLKDIPEQTALKLSGWQSRGIRVLTLVHCREEMKEDAPLAGEFSLLGFILLEDKVRKNAPEIFRYFYEQGVDIKLISGDDPVTVSAIAGKAGIRGYDKMVDMSRIRTDEEMAEALKSSVVFGRVTPQQKQKMVRLLKNQGHTVAMTGDGVNDVLALKDADVGIAMAEGSNAAKNTANLVLMDSDFATLPLAVNEGRRVINNIKSAASMFLIKTGFSLFNSVITICFGQPYPFRPIDLSVINGCAVGIPTFLLQFEPNYTQVNRHFFRAVFRHALPPAMLITAFAYLTQFFGLRIGQDARLISTLCVLSTGWIYLECLRRAYQPPTAYRKLVVTAMCGVFFASLLFGKNLLELSTMPIRSVVVLLCVISFSSPVLDFLTRLYDICMTRMAKREEERHHEGK